MCWHLLTVTYSIADGISLQLHDISLFLLEVVLELSDLTGGLVKVSLYLADMPVVHVLFVCVPLSLSLYLILNMTDLLNWLLQLQSWKVKVRIQVKNSNLDLQWKLRFKGSFFVIEPPLRLMKFGIQLFLLSPSSMDIYTMANVALHWVIKLMFLKSKWVTKWG